MAKSGGTLNNICAKLLKTTNTAELPPDGHDVTNTGTNGSHCDTQNEALYADMENNNASIKDSVISELEGARALPGISGEADPLPGHPPSGIPDDGNLMDSNPPSESRSSIINCETPTLSKPSPSSDITPVLSHNTMQITQKSTPGSGGSSRRNRRKNATPRNIAQFKPDYSKDEIPEEYEIKNNVEKTMNDKEEWEEEDPLVKRMRIAEEGDNETALDLSAVSHSNQDSDSLATSTGSVHIETLAAEEYTMDMTGALDLSVAKTNKGLPSDKLNVSNNSSSYSNQSEDQPDPMDNAEFNEDEDNSSQDSFAADFFQQRINHFLPTTARPEVPEKSPPRSDATTMKDYAQNTMNELLSLYGLGKQEAESITESVSLENFSSGSILARQPGQKLAASTALAAVAAEQQRSTGSSNAQQQQKRQEAATAAALKAAVEGKGGVLAGLAKTLGARASAPGEDGDSTPSSTASSPGTQPSEGIYAKFVDNISKLSKLPPGKTHVLLVIWVRVNRFQLEGEQS